MNKLLFTKISFDFIEINKYFLTVLIFIFSFFILSVLLSLNQISIEYTFKISILTLMNTVNSSAYGLDDFDFNNLYFFTKYSLIFFMIIGRIELLTVLIIVKKFLFKNQFIVIFSILFLRSQLSWIEHRFSKPRVEGSNPSERAIFPILPNF